MSIYTVERGLAIGRAVFLGKLGPTVHELDESGSEDDFVDLGAVQYEPFWGPGNEFGRDGYASYNKIKLVPFTLDQHHIYHPPNSFGGWEEIVGRDINKSFLRGHFRFSESKDAAGSIIFFGFQVPFIKLPVNRLVSEYSEV